MRQEQLAVGGVRVRVRVRVRVLFCKNRRSAA